MSYITFSDLTLSLSHFCSPYSLTFSKSGWLQQSAMPKATIYRYSLVNCLTSVKKGNRYNGKRGVRGKVSARMRACIWHVYETVSKVRVYPGSVRINIEYCGQWRSGKKQPQTRSPTRIIRSLSTSCNVHVAGWIYKHELRMTFWVNLCATCYDRSINNLPAQIPSLSIFLALKATATETPDDNY